jgi:hypothetical protein
MRLRPLAAMAVLAGVLLRTPSLAEAQTCQSHPLPYGFDQTGVLDRSDCTVNTIGPLRNVTGEYWTLMPEVGDLVVVTVAGTSYWHSMVILDPLDVIVGSNVNIEGNLSVHFTFTALTSGLYRVFVTDLVFRSNDSTTYTIRARRVTVPEAPSFSVTVDGGQVALSWYPPLSPRPILEYVLEVGSVSGAADFGTFPVGTVTAIVTWAPTGVYFVRLRARNAFGWGLASAERRVSIGQPLDPPELSVHVAGRTVSLGWRHDIFGIPYNPEEISWELLVGSAPGLTDLLTHVISPGNAHAVQFFDVPPGQYYIRLRGRDTHGPGAVSNEVVARVF